MTKMESDHLRLLRSVFEPSPLSSVTEAVAAATEFEQRIYVERIDANWRWSFVHAGGAYPLIRITARFLGVDYRVLRCGFHSLNNGTFVLCSDPSDVQPADAWEIVDFDGPTSHVEVRRRILQAFARLPSDSF
jgi:hypothetical protein